MVFWDNGPEVDDTPRWELPVLSFFCTEPVKGGTISLFPAPFIGSDGRDRTGSSGSSCDDGLFIPAIGHDA
jgi:hypothetical protein